MSLSSILALVILTSLASVSFAQTKHYVLASATGNGNGNDWTNAYQALPATLVRGDIYYVGSGQYPSLTLNDAESGSEWITIQKATANDHGTDVGWSDEYGTGNASFPTITVAASYYNFNGSVGGGPGSWFTGHGFDVYSTGNVGQALIFFNADVHHIMLSHTSVHADRDTLTAAMKLTLGGNHDITVSYCAGYSVFGVFFHLANVYNMVVEFSYFKDNKSTADWHSEGISFLGTVTNLIVRHCVWWKIEGSAFLAGVNNGDAYNWTVHGNIFSNSWSPALYIADDGGSMSGLQYYNNLITNVNTSSGGIYISKGSDNKVYNNMWYHNVVNSLSIWADADYNWFYDNYRIDGCAPICDLNPDAVAAETHGVAGTGNPFVNWDGLADPTTSSVDFRLKAHTAPGLDVGAPFNVDMFGTERLSAQWDRGATQFTVPVPVSPMSSPASSPQSMAPKTVSAPTANLSSNGVALGASLFGWVLALLM